MNEAVLLNNSNRRLNILTGEWVLVSPHRWKRPWLGKEEESSKVNLPDYEPDCYLCPGNERAGGIRNPDYKKTFVFDNDFSAMRSDVQSSVLNNNELLVAEAESGICRVVCFSPHHNLTLSEMKTQDIRLVVDVWINQFTELGDREDINYVQIFENKGEIMGCSNPHPHGQIWANKTVPVEPAKETLRMQNYLEQKKTCILCDYLYIELKEKERVVVENDDFVVIVPFWAVWPFETIIISRRHFKDLIAFREDEKNSFADILKKISVVYDKVFNVSFPYSAGIHQAPTDGGEHSDWHFHYHFYPPLLRSATVKKFMVGYEMLCNPQRDLPPEANAEKLRVIVNENY